MSLLPNQCSNLPSDIRSDLEVAYGNPNNVMIGLDLDDLIRFFDSESLVTVVRSVDEYAEEFCCQHAVIFRSINRNTSMSQYQDWFKRRSDRLLITESTVVIPVILFDGLPFREWFLVKE